MIRINLLPDELRHRAQKPSFALNPEQALYFAAFIFGFLALTHLVLAGLFIVQSHRLSSLNDKWRRLEPQSRELEKAKKEYEGFSEDAKYLSGLASGRISWSEKLNRLSLDLPGGIWFNELSVSPAGFILKCSVMSLKKEEMGLINKFIGDLKKDAAFYRDFNAMELSSAETRAVAGYDITDFILTGSLKR